MRDIPESDWKKLRAMKEELLDTACSRIFEKLNPVNKIEPGNNHKNYLKLWKILEEEDEKISDMFDDLKRSNAIIKIFAMVRNGLVTEDKLKQFSKETQEIINRLNSI